MKYIPVMGLEIHAELLTNSKVYCSCENTFGGEVNNRVCPVCSGMPGTLPVINKEVVTFAVKAGISLDCHINEYSAFDRKNYFYPDLPKAYQITQFEYPICSDGHVEVCGRDIRINRIHIEEDAGKLIHEDVSLADFNRCGVPLIEIVTEPDFRTIEEVQQFVKEVALRLKYAGVCDARLEQGSLRVDVNISIMPEDSDEFGVRAEIKNLNSVKSIGRAIEYEIKRQTEILEKGESVKQETRRFDEKNGATNALRSKEDGHDYRYFPEPDIPPVKISEKSVEKIRMSMSESPDKRMKRYIESYKLSEDDARLIIEDKAFSDFYDEAILKYKQYKAVSNMMLGELNRNLNNSGKEISELKFSPENMAELVNMSETGIISKNAAKDVFKIMFETGKNPEEIAKENGFIMENNTEELKALADKVIAENMAVAESYRAGDERVFGFLMGQLVRCAGKSANPKIAKEVLLEKLKS